MNEWTNHLLMFFTLGPTMLATRLRADSTRIDIFNRASHPVIICFSFLPPCPPPCGKDMSRIRYSSVPYPGPTCSILILYLTVPIFFSFGFLPIVLSPSDLSYIKKSVLEHLCTPIFQWTPHIFYKKTLFFLS